MGRLALLWVISIALLSAQSTTQISFQTSTIQPCPSGFQSTNVAIGDFNGDQTPDIAVDCAMQPNGSQFAHQIAVLIGNGDGSFQKPVLIQVPSELATSEGLIQLFAADLNGDGKTDLVFGTSTGPSMQYTDCSGSGTGPTVAISFMLSQGGAIFSPLTTVNTNNILQLWGAADLNGDGLADLMFDGSYDGGAGVGIGIMFSQANGGFAPLNLVPAKQPKQCYTMESVVDVNGDGKPDLIVANYSNAISNTSSLSTLLNQGGGTFAAPVSSATFSSSRSVTVRPADFRGTGTLDLGLELFGPESGMVQPFFGNGTTSFQAPNSGFPGFNTSIVAIDVNGDGKTDLAQSDSLGGGMFYLSNGDGTFQDVVVPVISVGQVVDLNGDGKPDLVANTATGVSVMINTTAWPATPVITQVANAEGGAATIAPNTWVQIKGSNLAPPNDARIWQESDFIGNLMPTTMDGVSVTTNGEKAFVYYISPQQINVLTPPDLAAGPVQVQVTANGAVSAPLTVQAQTESPSFFVFNGGPYVIAVHSDGSLIGPTSLYPDATTPAQPGETIVVFANGFGATSTPVVSGALTQSGSLQPMPTVTVGGASANVTFAGLISPGLFQFNVELPATAPAGDNAIAASYNGVNTQPGTLITIAQ